MCFWLPSGMYLGMTLLVPAKEWKWYFLAALPATALFCLWRGEPSVAAPLLFAVEVGQACLAATLIRRFVGTEVTFKSIREFFGVMAYGGLLSPAIAGSFIALANTYKGLGFSESWFAWSTANGLGIMLLTPLLLSIKRVVDHKLPPFSFPRLCEAVAIFILIGATSYVTFVAGPGILAPSKTRIIVFVLWAALRFGMPGASSSLLWLAFLSAFFTQGAYLGHLENGLSAQSSIGILQWFLTAGSVFCLVPAIVLGERDRNLEALQASEARLKALTQTATEGLVLSRNGYIFDVNDQITEMFGYHRDEVIGKPITSFLAPLTQEHALDVINRGEDATYSALFKRADGSTFPAEVSAKVSRNGGDVIRMSALRDIGANRTAETQRLYLADMLASSDDAIIGKTLDGIVTTWNPAAEKIFGYTAAEAIGRPLKIIFPPDREHEEDHILAAISRGERIRHFETVRVRKDGTPVHISATISPIIDKSGCIIGVSKIARDITDSKSSERDLLLFRTLVDGANDGFEVTDPETALILDMNEGGLSRLGYTRAEILGSHLSLIRPNFSVQEFLQTVDSLRDGSVARRVTSRRRKDGSEFPVEITLRMVKHDREYLVSVVRDITEQQLEEARRIELEALLRRSQKMETVGRFAAGIAHDFNNILGAIFGCAALLKEDTEGNAEAQESTQEIVKAATRAKELVQQILTFSSLQDPKREPFEIGPVVREIIALAKATAPSNIAFSFEGDHDCFACGDLSQVHRVLSNLVQNGCHAMLAKGGALTVAVSEFEPDPSFRETHSHLDAEHYVCIRVKDTGHGIDPTLIDNIFEPFFTTKGVGRGTGLGLAISYGIIQANHGLITVESSVGQGSTFNVYLPKAENPTKAPSPALINVFASGHHERILLIDDDRQLLEATKRMLDRLDYDTDAFSDPQEAVAYVKANSTHYDLVITDLTMPNMTGTMVSKEIKRIDPNVPIILSSGFNHGMDKDDLSEAGITQFLQKPANLRTLGDAVRRALKETSVAVVDKT